MVGEAIGLELHCMGVELACCLQVHVDTRELERDEAIAQEGQHQEPRPTARRPALPPPFEVER
jgi:hypothetical protein